MRRFPLFLIVILVVVFSGSRNHAYGQQRPTIVLSPGHGWRNDAGTIDPGAVSGDLVEKDITLDVARRASQFLRNCAVDVYLTRDADDPLHTLNDVAGLVNARHPTIGVSIHVNSAAGNPSGVEAWSTVGGNDDAGSQRLGALLTGAINTTFTIANRGVKPETSNQHGGLYIHYWQAPAALVEIGFLQGDAALLRERRPDYAQAIAKAALSYLGLSTACLGGSQLPPSGAPTATALLLDTSGSMSESWRGGVKIESARRAASDIVTMMEQESQVGGAAHQVAVAWFNSAARVELPLTANYDEVRSTITQLTPTARTNMGKGIQMANEALRSASTSGQRIMILLSDGNSNEGLSQSDILSGPVQEAAQAGTCIYTVGFGDQNNLNEDLLRQIASASRCGQYYYASDAYRLNSIYIKLRHQSTGTIIAEYTGQVRQGETTSPEAFTVDRDQGELNITLDWKGSGLDLIVTDPKGQRVDRQYPGATLAAYARFVYLIVKNPQVGKWQISTFGRDVPEGILDYQAIASVRQGGTSQSSGLSNTEYLLILVGVIAVTALALAVIAIQMRPAAPRSSGHSRAGLSGPMGLVGFRGDTLTIGRDPRNVLVVRDEKASRQHARICRRTDGYVLYDQDSRNGTYVNGQRVSRCVLKAGDEIRIGSTILAFHDDLT